jgi:acyl-CoA synthetase (AMP-forming)/AMP-acid ligase II
MSQLLHLGEVISRNAYLFPHKLGARDLTRSLTYRQWNERAIRLANALLGMGLNKGDRVAILAYNCLEWMEFYVATAKAGLVAVLSTSASWVRRFTISWTMPKPARSSFRTIWSTGWKGSVPTLP